MSESVTMLLLWLAPAMPLLNTVLLLLPALREHAMRWSPLAALPALLLAVFGVPDTALALGSSITFTALALDEIGRIFLGFSAVLWLLSDWFARGCLSEDRHPLRFYLFFLLSMAGNFLLILAQDIPTFYSGFALMGFASCGLVVHRGDSEALRAGRIYLVLAAIGEVVLFVALGQLAVGGDSTLISEVVTADQSLFTLLLLLIGFGIKAGALALHFWLPLAHPAAPVPASAVLSGAMIKAGLLGWLRFLPLGLVVHQTVGIVLVVGGLLAAGLGALLGISQRNGKTVLAYSSFSQMGMITVGIGVGFLQPEAWPTLLMAIGIYALHHGLAKGALFLGVTPASEATTTWEIRFARLGLLLPALALAGAPFTSGTIAKLALKAELDYLAPPWGKLVGMSLTFAAMGTTLLMARFLVLAWPRKRADAGAGVQHRVWPPWMLSVLSVFVGVWMLPGTLEQFVYASKPEKIWGSAWPVLAGALLAVLAHRFFRWRGKPAPEGVPAGDIVLPLEWLIAHRPRRKIRAPEGVQAEGNLATTVSKLIETGLARMAAWESAQRTFSHGVLLLAVLLLVVLLLPN